MIDIGVKQVTISKQYGAHSSLIKIQCQGALFKVSDLFQWIIIVSSSDHLEDLYKAPDSILSFMNAIIKVNSILRSICKTVLRLLTDTQHIQSDYTLGRNLRENPYLLPIKLSVYSLLKHFHF